jgi:hypothetical protein
MLDSPITWATLNDLGGTAITFTSAGIKGIRENSYWVRPRISGAGAATALDVYLMVYAER